MSVVYTVYFILENFKERTNPKITKESTPQINKSGNVGSKLFVFCKTFAKSSFIVVHTFKFDIRKSSLSLYERHCA